MTMTMMAKFVAICPKCEKFYTMSGYQPDRELFCEHPIECKSDLSITETIVCSSTVVPFEMIRCKIVEIWDIK